MAYRSGKTYGHEIGLSCAFRQHKAESHCHFIHGYALSINIEFEANILDNRNWVIDFGGLKELKTLIQETFDHKVVVAEDDPFLDWFRRGDTMGILDLVVMPQVGCEAFAWQVYSMADTWLVDNKQTPRCKIAQVTVREHGANSATFIP